VFEDGGVREHRRLSAISIAYARWEGGDRVFRVAWSD
jgi:hypothetical protein